MRTTHCGERNLEQKKFMDICRIKEDTELTEANTCGFHVGDHIVIQIKFDGSNASFRYDAETGKLNAFSRLHQLDFKNTLSGFWNFVESLDADKFKNYPNYVFFGEWASKHRVVYKPEFRNIWLMYDVYDVETERWLIQDEVKKLAEELGFTYIHVLYDGEFVSWDHCKSFMSQVVYAETEEEGIVCKNMTRINNASRKYPAVLKIVNDKFTEVMKREKVIDPEKEAARANAQEIVNQVVTRNRVEKEIYKMRDEGIIPEKLDPEDMKLVAQKLPKRIFDDCMKEEKESVLAGGEFFGKLCNSTTMRHARSIILGDQ